MEKRIFTIRERSFMELIHKAYPAGVEYANTVMNLALKLSDVSCPFYHGSLLNNHGTYPFLQVEAMEYVENDMYSMQIVVSSKLDKGDLSDWIDSLSLTQEEKYIIKQDVRMCYKKSDGMLDMKYIDLLTYLVETMKALLRKRDERNLRIEEILKYDTGCSGVVTYNSSLTKNYLRKRLKAYNDKRGKAEGRFFIIHPYPGINRACVVSCISYK